MRAVGIGRRWTFWDVALRYRVAYSLEHYVNCRRALKVFRKISSPKPSHEACFQPDYNIGQWDASTEALAKLSPFCRDFKLDMPVSASYHKQPFRSLLAA